MRSFSALFYAIAIALTIMAAPATSMASAQGKKALVIVARDNFEQDEFKNTTHIRKDEGVQYTIRQHQDRNS